MIGAAFFNAHVYEEIEADPRAITQAIGVVILVTICGAAGGLIQEIIDEATAADVILELASGLVFGIVRWALWVTIVLMVGGGLLRTSGTETSWAEMGRVLGFAYSPGVISIFSAIPEVGDIFILIAFFWILAAAIMAVRQGMDYEGTGRAILVVVIAAVVAIIPLVVIELFEWRFFDEIL